MPKYWGKQIFAHGRFPEVGQKQKTEEKKERKRERVAGTTEMFLRSKVDKTENVVTAEHESVGCFISNNETKKLLKCALWINFLTLIMLFTFVPSKILAIIYSGCDEVAGKCEGFIVVMRL